MKGKTILILSPFICIAAYLIRPDSISAALKSVFVLFEQHSVSPSGSVPPPKTSGSDTVSVRVPVYSKEELSKFKGDDGGLVYLAILGHVYDVSKGRKHYGPGGGYEFFAGIDGSKAYVTGQFDKDGLTDDISELTPAEILSLENWKAFYDKDYDYVGKVEGAFYDQNGAELSMMDIYRKKLKIANLEREQIENDSRLFPPCNSEWSQANGGRIWCTTRSGGILRDWVGVPRLYYVAGSSKPRCACVRTTGPPSHDPESTQHKNRGDLDNPNLSVYPHCSEMSESCPMPQ